MSSHGSGPNGIHSGSPPACAAASRRRKRWMSLVSARMASPSSISVVSAARAVSASGLWTPVNSDRSRYASVGARQCAARARFNT